MCELHNTVSKHTAESGPDRWSAMCCHALQPQNVNGRQPARSIAHSDEKRQKGPAELPSARGTTNLSLDSVHLAVGAQDGFHPSLASRCRPEQPIGACPGQSP